MRVLYIAVIEGSTITNHSMTDKQCPIADAFYYNNIVCCHLPPERDDSA